MARISEGTSWSEPQHIDREGYLYLLEREGILVIGFGLGKQKGFGDLWIRLRALLKK